MNMNDKTQIITMLREEFNRWEELLASISEEQIITPHLPANLSIKDVVAHLWAWQQLSIARLEAALLDRGPEFSMWPTKFDPEAESDVDQINAWIYETYHKQPWSKVYRNWREGFLRFLELAEKISEKDLLDAGKFPWLEGQPLSLVLLGSYEHHHEDHLEPLLTHIRITNFL
jgi:hypothetical protein